MFLMIDYSALPLRRIVEWIISFSSFPRRTSKIMQTKEAGWVGGGAYNKTLQTRNLRKIVIFHSKLVFFLLLVTNTLALTNTLAYYRICTLTVYDVFIVQALALKLYKFSPQ